MELAFCCRGERISENIGVALVKETRAAIMRAERVADVEVCMVNVVMANCD